MDLEAAHRDRDMKLRRRMLMALHHSRTDGPAGGLAGTFLISTINDISPFAEQIESEDHGIALLRDLGGRGYVELQDKRTRKWQSWGIDHLFIVITAKGSDLVEERIPPDPMVEDSRFIGDES